jgi:hypothetical protein
VKLLNLILRLSLTVGVLVCSLQSYADNYLVDNLLQPVKLRYHPSKASLAFKLGLQEGSGEILNDGIRIEAPRLTLQKNAANELLFRASVPWVYLNNSEYNRFLIGDPTFLTTIAINEHQSFTVGVTEPAANRPVEPDVVRFLGFYTINYSTGPISITGQLGVEIPDRYAQKGQDDILSFGAAVTSHAFPISVTLVRKQVVDGAWWDITQPLESALNRTNITVDYTLPLINRYFSDITIISGIQFVEKTQYIFGMETSF